ncbi:MAG: hypothetical protein CMJ32_06595 [Phycisphaerae bacterium]|nr:hypothetical protein [Phycisphaerae bacterium]
MRIAVPFVFILTLLVAAMYLDRPRPRADLVIAMTGDVFTLDPQRMSYMQDLRMARAVYEGLVCTDLEGRIIPGVAKSWEVTEDGLEWTFHLREDARWSNGDPVTADDFVYSWRRAMLPDTASDYSSFFFHVRGAKDFFDWRSEALAEFASGGGGKEQAMDLLERTDTKFDELVGLDAVDPHTLKVQLRNPLPYFLDIVAFGALCPVHRETVEGYVSIDPMTGRIQQEHGWTKPGLLVSNGPYALDDWRYKRNMRLKANPHYWNDDSTRSRTIEVRSIEDPNTAVLAFETGAVDWLPSVNAEYRADMLEQRKQYLATHEQRLEELLRDGHGIDHAIAQLPKPIGFQRRNIIAIPTFGTDFYGFNCRPMLNDGNVNPFADPAVRRAFSMSIDKPRLAEFVTRMNEPSAGSLVPPDSIDGYSPPTGLPYDPERARAELANAGWIDRDGDGALENTDGTPFPVVDLLYSTGAPRYKDLSLAMKDMWEKALGVQVQMRGKDTKFYKEDLKQGEFMIGRGGWYGDYRDPTTFLELCHTDDGNNDRKYSCEEFDGLLAQAAAELDPARRMQILQDAERILVERDLPILPLMHFVVVYMYEPDRITGLSHEMQLNQYLSRIHRSGP